MPDHADFRGGCIVDLDAGPALLPPPERRSQAFLLWLRSSEFGRRVGAAADLIAQVLADNPHTTLQVTLEPTAHPDQLTGTVLESLLAASFRSTSYLDRFYSLQPAGLLGAKRLVVMVPAAQRASSDAAGFGASASTPRSSNAVPWARTIGNRTKAQFRDRFTSRASALCREKRRGGFVNKARWRLATIVTHTSRAHAATRRRGRRR